MAETPSPANKPLPAKLPSAGPAPQINPTNKPAAAGAKPGDGQELPPEEENPHGPTFWQQKWVQNGLPFATSLAVHLGLFILGFLAVKAASAYVFKDTHKEEVIIPDSQLAQDDNFGGIPNPGMGVDPTQKAAQDTDPTSTTKGFADKKTADLSQMLPGGGGEGGDVIASGEGSGPGHGAGTGGGIGAGLGSGTGTGGEQAAFGPRNAGGPPGPQSKIFGHGSNVKSIVYICDGSGSLVGGKDEALRVELKKAVNHLVPVQAFNVLIFHEADGKKFEGLANQLLMANPNNKAKLFDFVDNKMQFHGITNPLPALREAFKEHPQLIYLLTDGAFEDNDPSEKADSKSVMNAIADMNKDKRVHVNTILLLGKKTEASELKEFEEIMTKIAKDNGGVFQEASADDLD